MKEEQIFRSLAKKYLEARNNFLQIAEKNSFTNKNNNLIGLIGEFIAYQFLNDQKRSPKAPKTKTQKGFDFSCDLDKIKVSVKTISAENTYGSTTIISEPCDELIIVLLDSNYRLERIGLLTKSQFNLAFKNGVIRSHKIYARKSMLNPKGLITKYGKVLAGKAIKNYL